MKRVPDARAVTLQQLVNSMLRNALRQYPDAPGQYVVVLHQPAICVHPRDSASEVDGEVIITLRVAGLGTPRPRPDPLDQATVPLPQDQ